MKESNFTGGLLGLIGTWILVMLVCCITLGFGTPWGICIWQKWIADHSVIDGKQVYFDGTGGDLFVKFIIWELLCIVTLGIYSFWLWIKMRQWVAQHTHLRG